MTPYLLLIQACGLSQREAAELRGVRIDTVKSWCTGRNTAPQQALDQLRDLYALMVDTSEQAIDAIQQTPVDAAIVLGYPADDHEAQSLGLPCVGAWRAMAGMVIAALGGPVTLVPRGSTPETAAAMAQHGQ